MLTRLEIDGFKTFEKQIVDLTPFTAVVGSNAAGKSNLFDVVQLLSNLATRDVAEAVKDMRGEPLELFRQTPSGRERQLTFGPGSDEDPTWSPDGYFIAFASSRSGPSQIYLTTKHGDEPILIPTGPGEATSPAWGKL